MTDRSFRELYDEHFAFVWRSLLRLGVRDADIADLAQEVFIVAHRRLAEFEGRSKMSTWLFGIAMRIAHDHRRSAPVRREVADGGAATETLADPKSDTAGSADRRAARELLQRVIDELPEDQRAVFVLFELEGMSGPEIAEAVGAPQGTVASRLRLAREAFRRHAARIVAADERLRRQP